MLSSRASSPYTVTESGVVWKGPLCMYWERQWTVMGTSTGTFLWFSSGKVKRRVSVMKASTVVSSPKNWFT